MKTTVLHPNDPSTNFLSRIYAGKQRFDNRLGKDMLRQTLADSGRAMCFGHGLPQGLLGHDHRLVIDDGEASLFRSQISNIYIWCNANVYVERNRLSGFATGMFISEPMEAYVFNVQATAAQIEASNLLFADIVGRAVDLDLASDQIHETVMNEYQIEGNDVVDYNRNNIFSYS